MRTSRVDRRSRRPRRCALPIDVERRIERLGLGQRARKAVEHEARRRSPAATAGPSPSDDHGVGNELAGVHVALGLEAELGALGDGLAEDVARRDVR